ncbi:MAG TPA: Yip1 family protein [Verrucomicrobiae bacterium]|nr:Yip1 family protein [Verrucomicrobiae bacterium]
MIKALLLILAPAGTWERIARSRRSIGFVLFIYLAPTIALSLLIELAGHNYLATRFAEQGAKVVPRDLAFKYAGIQFGVGMLAAIVIAPLIKLCSETFHNRTTFIQCFAVAGYALGPFYLLHIFDAIPVLSPWITFAAGIFFSFGTLYHAIPQVLKPDPPHAFGLFVMSGFVLTMISLIARMVTLLALPAAPHLT